MFKIVFTFFHCKYSFSIQFKVQIFTEKKLLYNLDAKIIFDQRLYLLNVFSR